MQTLWLDRQYGRRMPLMKPGFTLIAVFTLALGIGSNTAKTSAPALTTTIQSQASYHSAAAIAQEPLRGDWVGGVQLGSDWIFIQVHFKAQGDELIGPLDIPSYNAMGLTLGQIRVESSGVHFEMSTRFGVSIFDGRLKQDTIEGTAQQGGQRGSFQIVRVTKDEVGEALEFQRSKNNYMRTGAGWETYAALRQRAQSRRWLDYPNTDASGPATKDAPLWASLRLIYFYEPVPILEKLSCPVLAIFGELDTPKGVAENTTNMERALKKAGNKNYTIKVFPQAGHSLLVGEAADRRKQPATVMYLAPGFHDTVVNWVLRQVNVPK